MVSTGCNVALGIIATLCAAVGIGLVILSCSASSIVSDIAKGQAKLTPTDVLGNFAEPPVPVYQRIYMFDLTNYKAVRNGAAPKVEERGPYVFKINMKKTIQWRGDLMWFEQHKSYEFIEDLSNGTLDDVITTVNPLLIQLFQMGAPFDRYLFFSKPVRELLYEGFDDPLLQSEEFRDQLTVPIIDGRVGYLVGLNNTIEGVYEVYTGRNPSHADKLNNIVTFYGQTSNKFYGDDCNSMKGIAPEGTNGELLPPFDDAPAKITLFNPQLCKPWDLHYSGMQPKNDINVARFEARGDFLNIAKTGNKTIDGCLESDTNQIKFKGMFDASTCQFDLPVIMSLPHYLNTDLKGAEVNGTEGLTPDPELHGLYLDVYPKVGFTVDMRIRVQVSFKLARGPHEGEMPEVIYPIFWQELMLYSQDSDHAAHTLYEKVEVPRQLMAGIAGFFGGLFMAFFVVIIAVALLLHHRSKRNNDTMRNKETRTTTTTYHHSVNYSRGHDDVSVSRH